MRKFSDKFSLRHKLLLATGLAFAACAPATFAGDLGINVILAGEIQPGVYGQVEIGNAPRPRVVYEQPRTVIVERRYVHAEPIYLHVPPGHAKHWEQHCREYNACGRPVYFVRSVEYEPEYQREHEHDYDHDRDDHDRGREHGRGHGHGHGHD